VKLQTEESRRGSLWLSSVQVSVFGLVLTSASLKLEFGRNLAVEALENFGVIFKRG
jgi:hypothetical protein